MAEPERGNITLQGKASMTPSSRTSPDTAPAYCTPFGSGAVPERRSKRGGGHFVMAGAGYRVCSAPSYAAHEQSKRQLSVVCPEFVGCIREE